MNKLIDQRIGDLPESATLEINKISNYYISKGRKIYKFGLGQSPFPIPSHIVEELQRNAHQKEYLPVEGLPELRIAVANYRSCKHGVNISSSNVMIGPGSKELLFLLQLCYHGELLLPNPSWVSYAPQAQIIGRNVHWINTTMEEDWKLQPEILDEYCKNMKSEYDTRLLLLNSPCNPTGSTYTLNELKELADISRKHNLCIMSDEIYGGCTFSGQGFEGHRGQSIATHYPEGTIIFGGISKWAGAGGWRLGVCSFPDEMLWLMKRMCAVASETYTSVSSPIQYAALKAYEIDNTETKYYLHATQTILAALCKYIINLLRSCGAKVSEPRGGFYVFPNLDECPRISKEKFKTSKEMCNHILENIGVAMLPGYHFGRPENEMTLRISFVNFDGGKAIQGWKNMGCPSYQAIRKNNFLQKYCSDTIEGIDILIDYLNNIT